MAPSTNGNGQAAPTEAKAIPQLSGIDFAGRNTGALVYLFGQPQSDTDKVHRETAFAAAEYCYAAINYRAEKVSEAPLIVTQETGDEDEAETLPDHELAPLLEEPSPDLDMGELIHLTRIYRDVTGGALWVLNQSLAGEVGMITVFDHDRFEVRPADGRIFGQFIVRTRNGRRILSPDDVVYWREPNPFDWGHGLAKVDVALAMLNLGKQAQATVKDILRNALFPSVVVQADKEWQPTQEEFEQFQALLNRYAERDKRGAPLALTGGGNATVVSQTLRNLMPDEVMDRVEATVASVFGIPPVVLGFLVGLKNSPWSQMSEARQMTYEDTIEPIWVKDERVLRRQMLRRVDEDPTHFIRFDTTDIRALQTDRLAMAEISEKTKDIGTVNERRALMGWEPMPDGDEIVQPMPAPQPGQDEEASGPLPERKSEDERKWAWLRFDVTTKAQEPTWRRAVAAQIERDEKAVMSLVGEHLREAKQAEPTSVEAFLAALDAHFNGDAPEQWNATVRPLLEATSLAAVESAASELGIAFELLQPGLPDFIQRHSATLVQQVTDTTKQAVRDALDAGIRAGESVPDIAERIRSTDVAFGKARSELIARTETTAATNGAQQATLEAYSEDSGVLLEKSWLSSRDPRVRDTHAAEDTGAWIPEGAVFPVTGLKAPGQPNCYVPETALQGAFVAGLRAHYSGEVVVLRTAGGHELTVTPNHPILTPGGFVAAKALRQGGEVLSHAWQGRLGPEIGEHNRPLAVEQVFGSLAERFSCLGGRVRPEHLHGDAARVHGEIDVVRPDGKLLQDFEAKVAELRRQGIFVPATLQQLTVCGAGAGDLSLDGVYVAPPTHPSRTDLSFNGGPSLGLDTLPFQPLCVGAAAHLDAFRFEPSGEETPIVSGLVTELLERFPREIATDQIVEVRHQHFAGHVYDLQSVYGWNIAGGILTSNCRCTLLHRVVEDR